MVLILFILNLIVTAIANSNEQWYRL